MGEFRVRFGVQNQFSEDELGAVHQRAAIPKNGEPGQECRESSNSMKIKYVERRSPFLVRFREFSQLGQVTGYQGLLFGTGPAFDLASVTV